MSFPPPDRTLTFPIASGRNRDRSESLPEASAVRCPSDEDLIARLQGKDSEALQLLFDRFSRLVFGIGLHILNDFGEAEEVVQEAFFCLYQKSKLFDPSKGGAKAWIAQIAFHRALDRKSYLARRGFYLGTNIRSLDDVLEDKTDLAREVETKLNRVQLEKAFEELPEVQRQTLELFYFEGWDLREISENLNEPLGNVRHHFYRGLERLRKSAFLHRLWEK
jgi:RNA polymerase sigma-70 factor (ECF subfamily)